MGESFATPGGEERGCFGKFSRLAQLWSCEMKLKLDSLCINGHCNHDFCVMNPWFIDQNWPD